MLIDPDLVATEGEHAFGSAIWFYMTPANPKPSMHEVVTGFFTPNSVDTSVGITATFGATTNIINGGIECN